MEEILEIIALIAMLLLFVFAVAVNLMLCFAKEKHRKIYIVHKRETLYRNLRSYYGGQNNKYTSHYTVDCRYPDSDKIHTLDCSYDIFRRIKEGKSYAASIKMLEIISISKK